MGLVAKMGEGGQRLIDEHQPVPHAGAHGSHPRSD